MDEHKYSGELVSRARQDERVLRAWKVNDSTQNGVPDIYILTRQWGIGQFEGKWRREMPKRPSTVVKVDWNGGNQEPWINDLHDAGIATGVYLGWMRGHRSVGYLFDNKTDWTHGVSAEWMEAGAMDYQQMIDAMIGRIKEQYHARA